MTFRQPPPIVCRLKLDLQMDRAAALRVIDRLRQMGAEVADVIEGSTAVQDLRHTGQYEMELHLTAPELDDLLDHVNQGAAVGYAAGHLAVRGGN